MTGADSVVYIDVPPAIDPRSSRDLAAAVQQAVSSPGIRVLVLSGVGGVFCKGLDVSALKNSSVEPKTSIAMLAEVLLTLRRAPVAVISVVDGVALGGGVGLIAASDVVIASDNSSFGLPEALFGIAPSIILPFLLERMRPQELRLWMLSAYARSASDAFRAGLVDVVVPAGNMERQTVHWVRQLSRPHADGVGRVKRITAEAAGQSLEEAVRKGVETTSFLLNDSTVLQRFYNLISE
jgi:enoyl-CoA hydratase/carnithine racemase